MLTNEGKWKHVTKKKKFREEFGNEEEAYNDFFRVGIAFNGMYSDPGSLRVKLYSQFYESDIIVASPLALRDITGLKMDNKANELEKQIDTDFLTNIEYVILDQAEGFVFQNMEHVEEVLRVLNIRPKKLTQLNDITRLKEIYTHKMPKGNHTYAKLFR